MMIYFDRDEVEILKHIVLYLYELAEQEKDVKLWTDANHIHRKIANAIDEYVKVIDDDMKNL